MKSFETEFGNLNVIKNLSKIPEVDAYLGL
jgi:hypothetical protein